MMCPIATRVFSKRLWRLVNWRRLYLWTRHGTIVGVDSADRVVVFAAPSSPAKTSHKNLLAGSTAGAAIILCLWAGDKVGRQRIPIPLVGCWKSEILRALVL
jgi:hypothetical protein